MQPVLQTDPSRASSRSRVTELLGNTPDLRDDVSTDEHGINVSASSARFHLLTGRFLWTLNTMFTYLARFHLLTGVHSFQSRVRRSNH